MNREELRAITAAGPHVIMADRESMLNMMDSLASAEAEVTSLKRERAILRATVVLSAAIFATIYALVGVL